MKRLTITVDTVCGGVPVAAGTVIEATDTDAQLLITMGRAEEAKDDGAPAAAPAAKGKGNRAITGDRLTNRSEGT